MTSYKKLAFGLGSNNPVVLDIGEVYTKLGFAGESEPRAVIATAIQRVGGPITYLFKNDHTSITGHHYDTSLKRSIVKFLEKIFYKELQISSKNQRIIICESLMNPTKIRELLADVLFHHFEVAGLVFAPQHMLSCFTVARGTALVVDCSYGETLVIPVIEGTPILWAWQAAPLGAAAIHSEIMNGIYSGGKLITSDQPPQNVETSLTEKVLEDIKVKACFVAEYERAKQIQKHKLEDMKAKNGSKPHPILADMVYPLDGNTKLVIPGSVRDEAPEVLFQQDNDRISVTTLALDALLQCPVMSRKELAESILVTGGTTLLPGFRHRLLFEMRELVATEERYKEKLSRLKFRVHNPPVPANLVSWFGAAVFASLQTFKRWLVTREFFDQHNGKLPDWCGLPYPKKVPDVSTIAPHSKASLRTSAYKSNS